MVRQLSGVLCYLSRIRYSSTELATRLLVNSLVLTELSCCSAVAGGIWKTYVTKLQTVVNFAARVIFNNKPHQDVSPVLPELRWLSVQYRLGLKLDTAGFMYKVARDAVPPTTAEMFTGVSDAANMTRGRQWTSIRTNGTGSGYPENSELLWAKDLERSVSPLWNTAPAQKASDTLTRKPCRRHNLINIKWTLSSLYTCTAVC